MDAKEAYKPAQAETESGLFSAAFCRLSWPAVGQSIRPEKMADEERQKVSAVAIGHVMHGIVHRILANSTKI
jgi:hypothetical protein